MIYGYGYNRTEADLRKAGAERVVIDTQPSRPERSEMANGGGIRPGDTLVVLSWMDLGGTQKASDHFAKACAAIDIEIKVAPGEHPKRGGRPIKFNPQGEDRKYCFDMWHNPFPTIAYKLERISRQVGHSVTRSGPDYQFGTPGNPKKQ